MCRRTAYLRDKLLEDLSDGRKTFVYKSDGITKSELLALHDALLTLGPVCLLNARLASGSPDFPAGAPGSVSEIRPGLFVGRLSYFVVNADAAYDDWVKVCKAVEGLRAASESRP